MIGERSVQWWSKWAQQAAELQTLQADAENRRKEGDNFYKMDAESIVTIRELSDDFLSLAWEQLVAVRRLVEQLDDDQLGTQLQFERYKQERRQQIASQMSAAINISDGEQSPKQPLNVAETGGGQPSEARVE